QDLARVACMSRYHFCRAFHSQMGVPPYRYVSERRIASATRMLTLSDKSLASIARESGFRGVHQFATLFTRIAGMSPGRFRRAHRSSNDTACAHESTANCSEKSASNERVLLGTTCAENRFE
ncbi:MAG: helix-turn-helix domain-containing protein, partial [Povalibacter sp.]